jgi:hypothetical protein
MQSSYISRFWLTKILVSIHSKVAQVKNDNQRQKKTDQWKKTRLKQCCGSGSGMDSDPGGQK